MKKKLILLCVLAMLVMGLAVNAHAAGEVVISASSVSGSAGANVTVTISAGNVAANASSPLTGGIVNVSWDTSKLEYVSHEGGSNLNSCEFSGTSGTNIAYNRTAGLTSDFTIATITFKILAADGTATITLNATSLENDDGDDLIDLNKLTSSNGTVTVQPAPHTHGNFTLKTAAVAGTGCLGTGTVAIYQCGNAGCTVAEFVKQGNNYVAATAQNKVAAAKGHALTEHKAVAPTCTADGTVAYWSCSGCSKNFPSNNKNAADNTALTTIVATKLGHDLTHHDAVTATCGAAGNIEYWSCSRCSKNFSNSAGTAEATKVAVDKLDHAMTKVDGTPATCAENGVKDTWTCSAGCGKTYLDEAGTTEATDANKVIDKSTVDHTVAPDATAKVPGTAATTSAAGTKDIFECDVCHQEVVKDGAKFVLKTDANVVIPKLTDTNKPGTSTDNKTGDKKAPKTGDETNIALWVVLFAVCATVVTVIATKKLRKN